MYHVSAGNTTNASAFCGRAIMIKGGANAGQQKSLHKVLY